MGTKPLRNNALALAFSRLFEKRSAKVGGAILVGFALFVLLGPLFIKYSPTDYVGAPNAPPSLEHIFGTDYLGSDIASQIIWGAYASVFVSLTGSAGATIIGLTVGVLGGFYKKLQAPLIGAGDIIITIPSFPLMILIGMIFPFSNLLIASILVIVLWPPISRAIRSQVLSLRERPFVDAARTSGMGKLEIVGKVIVPEVLPIALAYFVLTLAISTVFVVGLEFLGVGNLTAVNWGTTLYWAQQYGFFNHDWWWIIAPGAAITLFASSFALIGFSVEEVVNPRLRTQ
jgi:ABC-type dipeptide/oligopeptide/nickel transport system permease subunit